MVFSGSAHYMCALFFVRPKKKKAPKGAFFMGFDDAIEPRDRPDQPIRNAACTINAATQAMPTTHDSDRSACLSAR